MRRLALACMVALVVVPGAVGGATAAKPLLGHSGNDARFLAQTGQQSVVKSAFLGFGQGQTWGARFRTLFRTLQPVPMIHLGTGTPPPTREAITPLQISQGRGDAYYKALNGAIAEWNRLIYVRPMAEMNNKNNLYSFESKPDAAHHPTAYKRAFCRIFLILHGGKADTINARLRALGMPLFSGGDLPTNAYPGVLRVIWNPVVGQGGHEKYFPGYRCLDMVGNDIYTLAAMPLMERFYDQHRRVPFSIPEWGAEGKDDEELVLAVCQFLKSRSRTETAVYFEAKPTSIYDLGDKPESRAAYRRCVTPLGGPAPGGQSPAPGPATIPPTSRAFLSLVAAPRAGPSPLDVTFQITENVGRPVARWQLVFGDGQLTQGTGRPPATRMHTYSRDGVYQAVLIVWLAPPFTGTAIRLLTGARVEVGDEPGTLLALRPSKTSGKAPLVVSFRLIANPPRPITRWELLFGDGGMVQGTGKPPNFSGHTYKTRGAYRAVLIVYFPSPAGTVVRLLTFADIRAT